MVRNSKSLRMISLVLVITLIFSMFAISASAASATPSFGSAPTAVTLYINDSNNDSRAINIKVNNWKSGYTYRAYSDDNSVAVVKDASVNSKSGVLFTIQAKYLGSTKVIVQMCKSGRVVQSKTISVTVKARTQATPTSLKCISATSSSLRISYSLSNKNYVTGYWIQVSTDRNFRNNVKSYKVTSKNQTTATLTGLKSRTAYFVRVASLSTLNNCYTISGYTSMLTKTN
ncbi:MAG: fibronectin type III domain-containing protein [Acutalibacteraceae bacterium]